MRAQRDKTSKLKIRVKRNEVTQKELFKMIWERRKLLRAIRKTRIFEEEDGWLVWNDVNNLGQEPVDPAKSRITLKTKPSTGGQDCDGTMLSGRTSDLSFTNSLATSSFVRCDRILRIVQPVSSILMRLPRLSQQAQLP